MVPVGCVIPAFTWRSTACPLGNAGGTKGSFGWWGGCVGAMPQRPFQETLRIQIFRSR